jgi:hypothetical protein
MTCPPWALLARSLGASSSPTAFQIQADSAETQVNLLSHQITHRCLSRGRAAREHQKSPPLLAGVTRVFGRSEPNTFALRRRVARWVDPPDATRIVREARDGTRRIGRVVGGKFRLAISRPRRNGTTTCKPSGEVTGALVCPPRAVNGRFVRPNAEITHVELSDSTKLDRP